MDNIQHIVRCHKIVHAVQVHNQLISSTEASITENQASTLHIKNKINKNFDQEFQFRKPKIENNNSEQDHQSTMIPL
jgi:hypothetical protein